MGSRWIPRISIPQSPGGGGGGGGQDIQSVDGAWSVPMGVGIGDVIYTTGAFAGDIADNLSMVTMPAVGIVIAKPTPITATVAYLGEVAAFGALSVGVEYFVGTSGAVTTAAPVAVGSVVQRLGVAISGTTLLLIPSPVTVVQ